MRPGKAVRAGFSSVLACLLAAAPTTGGSRAFAAEFSEPEIAQASSALLWTPVFQQALIQFQPRYSATELDAKQNGLTALFLLGKAGFESPDGRLASAALWSKLESQGSTPESFASLPASEQEERLDKAAAAVAQDIKLEAVTLWGPVGYGTAQGEELERDESRLEQLSKLAEIFQEDMCAERFSSLIAYTRRHRDMRGAEAAERVRAMAEQLAGLSRPSSASEQEFLAEPVGRPLGPDDQPLVGRVSDALNRADWSDPVFDHRDAVAFARSSHLRGDISKGQYATTALRWAAFKDWPHEPGDEKARPILTPQGGFTQEAEEVFGRLTPSQARAFRKLIGGLPESERRFWVLRVREKSEYHGIHHILKVPTWVDQALFPGSIIVGTSGVFQAYLDATHGVHAVRLEPSFHAKSDDDVINGAAGGGRVLGLPDPESAALLEADRRMVDRYTFAVHDVIHADGGSELPWQFRQLIPRLGAIVRSYAARLRELREAADPATRKLFDRELLGALYRIEHLVNFNPFGQPPGICSGFIRIASHDGIHLLQDPLSPTLSFRLSEALLVEYGPVFSPLFRVPKITYDIVRDMALHPEAWAAFDIEKEVAAMGSDAQKLFWESRNP